jgi:hypothetical protein
LDASSRAHGNRTSNRHGEALRLVSNPTKPAEIQHKWRCPGHEPLFDKPDDFTRARVRSTGHVFCFCQTSELTFQSRLPYNVRAVIPVIANHTSGDNYCYHSVHYTHRILFHQTIFRQDARTAKQVGEAADLRARGCFVRCG